MKWIWYTALTFFPAGGLFAQNYDLPLEHITLDSVTVTAVKHGLDIQDLISIMQFDSTLYIAFNNLHFANYRYDYDLEVLDKNDEDEAWKKETIRQEWDGTCREQSVVSSEKKGKFTKRKGRQKYYTAELFDRTFYTKGRTCGERRKSNFRDMVYGDKEEGHLGAIKRVVFNPGSPVNLPIIGKKFALFESNMVPYYDYSIESKTVGGYDCYEFTITVKPEFENSGRDVIVRQLTTAFNKTDFQVIARDYHLYYWTGLVKVDIRMDIALGMNGGRFFPDHFHYDGFWNVPFKHPEHIRLATDFSIAE